MITQLDNKIIGIDYGKYNMRAYAYNVHMIMHNVLWDGIYNRIYTVRGEVEENILDWLGYGCGGF